MKARIKATGEVHDIVKVLGFEVLLSDGSIYDYNKVEYITEPDWQHYHIQAAIAAMQAELTNPNNVFSMCEDKQATIVRRAVRYADELIAELQKKGEQQ